MIQGKWWPLTWQDFNRDREVRMSVLWGVGYQGEEELLHQELLLYLQCECLEDYCDWRLLPARWERNQWYYKAAKMMPFTEVPGDPARVARLRELNFTGESSVLQLEWVLHHQTGWTLEEGMRWFLFAYCLMDCPVEGVPGRPYSIYKET